MSPLVSVIIANYNSGEYLAPALDSILNQTLSNFEIVVVDDKSTDESLTILRDYASRDNRIKAIELDENSGVTQARQIGLEAATGNYIAILDADDISLPERLQLQCDYFDSHPDVVLLASDYGVIDEKGNLTRDRKKVPVEDSAIRWYLTFGNCFAHSTIMFRNDSARAVDGYDLDIKRGPDMEMSSKLLSQGKASAIPVVLAHWRSFPKSMTKSVSKVELSNFYISSVRNSIKMHLDREVDFDTTAAVYYNTKKAASTLDTFRKALDLILTAFEKYTEQYDSGELNYLYKSTLKHMMKLNIRNRKQKWWTEGENYWLEIFRSTLVKSKYNWFSPRNLSTLQFKYASVLIKYKLTFKL